MMGYDTNGGTDFRLLSRKIEIFPEISRNRDSFVEAIQI